MDKQYSVLMSVYKGERPEYLHTALTSIIHQTLAPDDIVLVCDGPLKNSLELVIGRFDNCLTLVRLPENRGLGKALAEGIRYCKHEWIARMDSDDISIANRCEWQLAYVDKHPEVDVLSGGVAEFMGEALSIEEAERHVFSRKGVPVTNVEIADYIKYRNPINHPCAMFRKSKVLAAGGYQPCDLFEDYDLWVRMYLKQYVFANLPDTILYMRVNDMHRRRGGVRYAKAILRFWTRMYRYGMIGFGQYLHMTSSRIVVSLLPNRIRKLVYEKKLRNH